ncbi:MAG: hypothetical protein ACRDJT_04535 [Actinomycetota bacterium]
MKRLFALLRSIRDDADRRARSGKILGLLFIALGFAFIGKAWDGAASINFVQGQIPYLLSGGFMGLALVVTGCTLIFLTTLRSERRALHEKFDEIATLLGRNLNRMSASANGAATGLGAEQVVAGVTVYHRPGCKILEGKDDAATITVQQAAAEGLSPCRSCEPPKLAEVGSGAESANEPR